MDGCHKCITGVWSMGRGYIVYYIYWYPHSLNETQRRHCFTFPFMQKRVFSVFLCPRVSYYSVLGNILAILVVIIILFFIPWWDFSSKLDEVWNIFNLYYLYAYLGAKVNACDGRGSSALAVAARRDSAAACRLLLACGADTTPDALYPQPDGELWRHYEVFQLTK